MVRALPPAEQRHPPCWRRGEEMRLGGGVYLFVAAGGLWSILCFLATLRQSCLRKAAQPAELARSLGGQEVSGVS